MNISGDDLTVRESALQDAAITDGRLVAALLDYNARTLID
jgi:hypothetical protein